MRVGRDQMVEERSAVLEYNVPEPGETARYMQDKLRLHTDSWHLFVDFKSECSEIVVIYARSRDAYTVTTVLAPSTFRTGKMDVQITARLNRKTAAGASAYLGTMRTLSS